VRGSRGSRATAAVTCIVMSFLCGCVGPLI
jgi:hypothetical protein